MRNRSQRFTVRIGQPNTRIFLTAMEDDSGACVGFHLQGHSAEDMHLSNLLSVFSKVATMALESGRPLADVVDSMLGTSIDPRGCVRGSERVATCRSVLDWAGKELAIQYLGRDDLSDTARP